MQDLCSHTQNYVFLLHASSYLVCKTYFLNVIGLNVCEPCKRSEWFFSCIYNMNNTKPLVVIFYAFVWMIYRIPTMVLHTIKVPLNIHVNMIVRCIIAVFICDVACMTMVLHESYISITLSTPMRYYLHFIISTLWLHAAMVERKEEEKMLNIWTYHNYSGHLYLH